MQKKFKASLIISLIALVVSVLTLGAFLLEIFIGGMYTFNDYFVQTQTLITNLFNGNFQDVRIYNVLVTVGYYFLLALIVFIVALVKKHPKGLLVSLLFIFMCVVSFPSSIIDALATMIENTNATPTLGVTYTIYGLICSISSLLVTLLSLIVFIVELVALASIKKNKNVEAVQTQPVEEKSETENNETADGDVAVPQEINNDIEPESIEAAPKEDAPIQEEVAHKEEKPVEVKEEKTQKVAKKKTTTTTKKEPSSKKQTTSKPKKVEEKEEKKTEPVKEENKKPSTKKAPKKESKSAQVQYFISKHRQTNKWQFKKDGSTKAIRLFTRKDEAIKFARQYIKDSPQGGELTIHG